MRRWAVCGGEEAAGVVTSAYVSADIFQADSELGGSDGRGGSKREREEKLGKSK